MTNSPETWLLMFRYVCPGVKDQSQRSVRVVQGSVTAQCTGRSRISHSAVYGSFKDQSQRSVRFVQWSDTAQCTGRSMIRHSAVYVSLKDQSHRSVRVVQGSVTVWCTARLSSCWKAQVDSRDKSARLWHYKCRPRERSWFHVTRGARPCSNGTGEERARPPSTARSWWRRIQRPRSTIQTSSVGHPAPGSRTARDPRW